MKKTVTIVALLTCALTASAQFEQNKFYVGSSLTGLDMNYSGKDKFCLGLEAEGGYFLADNFLIKGFVGYDHRGKKDEDSNDKTNDFYAGIGFRYYILQNGLYLGLNGKYIHETHNFNDVVPEIELGYAFFINHHVTIEPAIYYDQSFKRHSDYSKIGLRLGVGLYLYNDIKHTIVDPWKK